jgi:hypothetical protein
VSDQAGLGLGGWLKLLRQNPLMALNDALQTLPDPSAQAPTEQAADILNKPVQPFILASANQSVFTGKSLTIMAISACVTAGLIFFLYQLNIKNNNAIDRAAAAKAALENEKSTTSEVLTSPENQIVPNEPSQNDDIEAKAKQMLADREKENELNAQKLTAKQAAKNAKIIPAVLSPQDTEIIKTLETGQAIMLQGIPRSAKFSSTDKSIYIAFSEPYNDTDIRVVMQGDSFKGKPFTEEVFAGWIGKGVVFTGKVYRESFHDRPPYVKIDNMRQARWAKLQAPTKETPNSVAVSPVTPSTPQQSILTPDDVEAISKIKSNEPTSVKGVVKTVKIPGPGKGLYIDFSNPNEQIRVVIYPRGFDGGPYDHAQFEKIEQEYQNLVGKTVLFEGVASRQIGKVEPHFVLITKRDQIKIEK